MKHTNSLDFAASLGSTAWSSSFLCESNERAAVVALWACRIEASDWANNCACAEINVTKRRITNTKKMENPEI